MSISLQDGKVSNTLLISNIDLWTPWPTEGILFHSQTFGILFLWNKGFIKFQPVLDFAFILYCFVENILDGIDSVL